MRVCSATGGLGEGGDGGGGGGSPAGVTGGRFGGDQVKSLNEKRVCSSNAKAWQRVSTLKI